MQFVRPIGVSLPALLLERVDKIARSKGVSRSNVARVFLVRGLAEYERNANAYDRFETDLAGLSRSWRHRSARKATP